MAQYNTYHYGYRPVRNSRKMRRKSRLPIFLMLLLAGYVAYACVRPIAYTAQLAINPPEAGKPVIQWPINGQAAIGIEGQGRVAVSSEQKVAIASITKLVTGLAVLEKKPLRQGEPGQLFSFSHDDEATYQDVVSRGGAALPVEAGQSMTQRQALEAMLLPSANNIAIALSKWVFGSEAKYVAYANDMVKRLGLTQTHIAGASGLETGTTSTPSELIKLIELTLKSPVLTDVTNMPETTIPGFPTIKNINHISGVSKSVHALKVGLNDDAGSCLVFWAEPPASTGPRTKIYGAIVGQTDFNAVRSYVNELVHRTIPANFTYAKIASAGQPVSKHTDPTGKIVTATAIDDILIPHWRGQEIAIKISKTKATDLEVKTANTSHTYALMPDKQPQFASTMAWRLLHPL